MSDKQPSHFPSDLKEVVFQKGCSKQPNERSTSEDFKSESKKHFPKTEKENCLGFINSEDECLQNQPTKLFVFEVDTAEQKVIDNNYKDDKEKQMIKELKKLATEYSQLEIQTQRAVMTIRGYGHIWKELAEDFLVDGKVTELWEVQGDIGKIKHFMEKASENYQKVRLAFFSKNKRKTKELNIAIYCQLLPILKYTFIAIF
jgi:hypothetical protein